MYPSFNLPRKIVNFSWNIERNCARRVQCDEQLRFAAGYSRFAKVLLVIIVSRWFER